MTTKAYPGGDSGNTDHPVLVNYYHGRSLRCRQTVEAPKTSATGTRPCHIILVHPEGDTNAPYVHWTDRAPDGTRWIDHAIRNPSNGRLIVPADWRERATR